MGAIFKNQLFLVHNLRILVASEKAETTSISREVRLWYNLWLNSEQTNDSGTVLKLSLIWYIYCLGFDLWLSGDRTAYQYWPKWQWYYCRRFIDFHAMKNRRQGFDEELNSPSSLSLRFFIEWILEVLFTINWKPPCWSSF